MDTGRVNWVGLIKSGILDSGRGAEGMGLWFIDFRLGALRFRSHVDHLFYHSVWLLSGRGSVVQGPPDFSVRTQVCLCHFRLHAGFRVYLSVQGLRMV